MVYALHTGEKINESIKVDSTVQWKFPISVRIERLESIDGVIYVKGWTNRSLDKPVLCISRKDLSH